MPFKTLLDTWKNQHAADLANERFSIRLPCDDLARVKALAALFPGVKEEALVSDLLNTALDEIEAAMPYVPGDKVIREDEFGDPIYEDVGLTPRFLELVNAKRAEIDES